MRYTCVSTSCGCRSPSLAKRLDADILAAANVDRIAKARKPVAVTAVGRYVDRKAPALARSLRKTLTAAGKRFAAAVAREYGKRMGAAAKARRDVSIAEQILAGLDAETLSRALVGDLEGAMLAAFRKASRDAVLQVGFEADESIVHQLDERARDYAAERGGELIKDLAGTTRDDMKALIGRAVEEGMSTDDLAAEVEGMGAFGPARAQAIARTELAYAHVQGNVGGWEETGEVAGTRWLLGDLHDVPDICDECVDRGIVPLGDEYEEGIEYPPAHVNCICDLEPILKGEE